MEVVLRELEIEKGGLGLLELRGHGKYVVRQAAGLDKAANNPGAETAGSITEADLEEIAQIKMPALNAYDIEAAKLQVRGTARSMGIEVV